MNSVINHRAHQKPRELTLGELAKLAQATLQGDPEIKITGVGTLANAVPGQLTFLASPKYAHYLATTKASAVVISPNDANQSPLPALITADPKYTFARVVHLLYPFSTLSPSTHPSALIGEECDISPSTFIGPNCVIGNRVKIGKNVILQSGCYIGDDCEIGESTIFYANAVVYHGCKIGNEVTVHSGTVIGSDGFGFANHKGRWLKVPQVGGVKIGDRVEIGANTTIDRGAIDDTEIGNDVILDNLIQIAHNVKINDGTAIASGVGIAGSTVIGKHCQIGGGTCIVGHLTITDHVNIVGSSNVGQSITEPGTYASGLTVNDIHVWKRNLVRFHQLDSLAKRLIEVEKKLKTQEEA